MSQRNVELVRRGIESVEAFWALLDEDVVWDLGRDPPPDIQGVYVGRDSVIAASRRYWGTWDEYSLDADELIDAGSSVVVVVHERGRGKGSGAPLTDIGRRCGPFAKDGSFDGSCSGTRPTPSKPPGCRSSRGATTGS